MGLSSASGYNKLVNENVEMAAQSHQLHENNIFNKYER